MSTAALMKYFYSGVKHPYRVYRDLIKDYLCEGDIVLDIGCGREAPDLEQLSALGSPKLLIGLDVVSFSTNRCRDAEFVNANASHLCLKEQSVDLAISRGVLEHLDDPATVFNEVYRVLRCGGHFILLTPNRYDYTAVVSRLIPNRYHARIVSQVEGRKSEDVFRTHYRVNSQRAIDRYSGKAGFNRIRFEYLGQYPAYLTFSMILFLLGTGYDKLTCRFECLRKLRGWILAVLRKPSDMSTSAV